LAVDGSIALIPQRSITASRRASSPFKSSQLSVTALKGAQPVAGRRAEMRALPKLNAGGELHKSIKCNGVRLSGARLSRVTPSAP
jgi:hypothetical protein